MARFSFGLWLQHSNTRTMLSGKKTYRYNMNFRSTSFFYAYLINLKERPHLILKFSVNFFSNVCRSDSKYRNCMNIFPFFFQSEEHTYYKSTEIVGFPHFFFWIYTILYKKMSFTTRNKRICFCNSTYFQEEKQNKRNSMCVCVWDMIPKQVFFIWYF